MYKYIEITVIKVPVLTASPLIYHQSCDLATLAVVGLLPPYFPSVAF